MLKPLLSQLVASAFLISAAIALGQGPLVPKLPHVPTGKITASGLDHKVPLPKDGLVPDKETAIKVAEVILFRLYGEKNITAQKPYSVTKDENIWWVCGAPPPSGSFGSSFKIAISQQTGAILYLEE
jgi:hypothetical protein